MTRPRLYFDGEPDHVQRMRNLYRPTTKREAAMNATDAALTCFLLGVAIVLVLGLETAFYRVRAIYRTWQVRRLLKAEARAFQRYLDERI